MKNSGIEKETDIIHLHCSYGNHQFYFEQENAYVFYKSETAKIIQQIIQAAEKIKKMDISMLCCVVMRSLYGSVVSRMRFLPKLTDICRMEKIGRMQRKNFYQPGFEGIGGIKTIEILMQEKCS